MRNEERGNERGEESVLLCNGNAKTYAPQAGNYGPSSSDASTHVRIEIN